MFRVLWKQQPPVTYAIRQALENSSDYTSAVQFLSTKEIPASCYFIVSGVGPNEGGVIEREYQKTYEFYSLSEKEWFLVQTNYDRDLPDPERDQRRIPAENRMVALGAKNISVENIFNEVMSLWPNCNAATISTQIYLVRNGSLSLNTWQ